MSSHGITRQIHASAVVDAQAIIGEGTSIWHWTRVCAGVQIGARCTLGQGVYVGDGVTIGSGVKIQNNAVIAPGVALEDDVFCGPSIVFADVDDPRVGTWPAAGNLITRVRRGASLGANCTVKRGVEIGQYAMIAAGAVVTQDVGDFELVMGSPARRHGWVSRAGLPLRFAARSPYAQCQKTGEKYLKRRNRVSLRE